jgi:ribonuclease P protein component
MIKKGLRISSRKDIAEIFREGFFLNLGSISAKFRKNGMKNTRLGVFLGVKYSKKAVERNRIKRKIWAVIAKKQEKLKKGFDIAIMPSKKLSKDISPEDLDKLIQAFLEKSALIEK